MRHVDPDTTPDGTPENPPPNPAPAPRSSPRRNPPRPSPRPVADDAETREFDSELILGDRRPTLEVLPDRSAEPTVPTNIYRARRPAAAAMVIIPLTLFGLLLLRGLAIAAFGNPFRIEGVIASCLALGALPLLATGLYGLITGAAHGAEQWGFKVWARPPLAYLAVGLVLVTAAGLAVR